MTKLEVFFMPHPPIIIPEIGMENGKEAENTIRAMEELGERVGELKPETIIFITPHGNSFHNGTCILDVPNLSGDFSAFGFPDIGFQKRVNQELSRELFHAFEREGYNTIHLDEKLSKRYRVPLELDNGVMVPMYFIDRHHRDYDMVHITPGGTPLKENFLLGKVIQKMILSKEQRVLMVCSGDLSHALKEQGPYRYHPSGPLFDQKVHQAIEQKDALSLITMNEDFVEEAAQCGLRSFLFGFGFMDGYDYDPHILSYEGPFGVGYLTGWIRGRDGEMPSLESQMNSSEKETLQKKLSQEDDYIKLARKSIEEYVKNKRRFPIEKRTFEFSKDFLEHGREQRAGVFVSIHKHGELRGCIGTIEPVQDDLLEEIIQNSISSCSYDPRFLPVEPDELEELDIKVDVLKEPEPIQSLGELDVKRYGVIVEKGTKRGLLLPNLEGINSVNQQVDIAMSKAGIRNPNGMKLYRFEVIRHE